jgi:hypothetical protein
MESRNTFADLGWTTGLELGVAKGNFSRFLLRGGSDCRRLWSVDRWSDHHDLAEYMYVVESLREFGTRSTILRATFKEALPLFPDNHFDFIYVDGYAHTGQDGGETIRDWWGKLALGGLYAGHDYDPKYPKTVAEVDSFVKERGLKLNLTEGKDQFESWYIYKT